MSPAPIHWVTNVIRKRDRLSLMSPIQIGIFEQNKWQLMFSATKFRVFWYAAINNQTKTCYHGWVLGSISSNGGLIWPEALLRGSLPHQDRLWSTVFYPEPVFSGDFPICWLLPFFLKSRHRVQICVHFCSGSQDLSGFHHITSHCLPLHRNL